MENKTFFGKELRAMRLKAGYGLRLFAQSIPILPSRLSRIENGWEPSPSDDDKSFRDKSFIERVCDILEIKLSSKDIESLMDTYVAPFQYQSMPTGLVPIFVTKRNGEPLSEQELQELTDHLRKEAEDYNAKYVTNNSQ